MKSKAWTEKFMQGVFLIAACASVLAVALICIFLFANGAPAMKEIGFGRFLSGVIWRPNNDIYGILPMIVGSLYVTAGAIIIGVPIGILTAVFMAFYCPKRIYWQVFPLLYMVSLDWLFLYRRSAHLEKVYIMQG